MDNLDFKVQQTAGKIDCNFAELKSALAVQMSAYEDAVVTEDTIPAYKGELATLRKIRTAVDNRRKEVEREYCVPINQFKEEVKSLLEEIDKPINLINDQLKLFEEDRKIKKKVRVEKLYKESVGEYLKYLPFEKNFDERWLNKSVTDQDIQFDISALKVKVKNDLGIIESLNSEIYEELLSTYEKSGNDLSAAIRRNQQYESDKAKVVEQVKEAEKPIEEKKVEEPTQIEAKNVEVSTSTKQLDDLAQMVRTAKIIISLGDLAQVKETLDFMGIKYQVEGE